MGDRRNRAFHYAVLLSIFVHAVVLLASPSLREAARRIVWPEPLVARLVEAPPVQAPAEAQPEPPAPPRVDKPQPSVVKPAAKPAPEPVPTTQPAPVAKAAPEPQPQVAAPAAEPAPAAPAPQSAAPAARAGADVDADTVGRYRMLVIEEARKLKRFPRAARDNNWEGRTRLRVSFGADGRRSSVAVVRSSGHEILDREALDTVTRADVPVPAGLRGKEFAFEIEVAFELSDSS
ncbi:MAG TPA: energy transducer TonB [Burkholderiales bacterium]